MYPEAYRKGQYVKGSNDQVPEPFRVGRIIQIYVSDSVGNHPEPMDVKLKIAKFYRWDLVEAICIVHMPCIYKFQYVK